MPAIKGRYFLLTIPVVHLPEQPTIKDSLVYLKGQQEIGAGGLHHWQILAVFSRQTTLNQCKSFFCPQAHVELSRSSAANDYVWKDDTSVQGTRFELGALPLSRARKADWDSIYDSAKTGDTDSIPKDILIRHYSAIKRISVDNMLPVRRDGIQVFVYWGDSGTGKTHKVWQEAGDPADVYIKNPNTKWWDGYRGQKTVLIDDFVGLINLNYLLVWLDKYPQFVEIKGYSTSLLATKFFITSNLSPDDWYPTAIPEHKAALRRRFTSVTHFDRRFNIPPSPLSDISLDFLDDLLS